MIKITDLNLKKKIPQIHKLNLQISEGESYVLLSSDDIISTYLINIFSGLERNFKGSVELEDTGILSDSYCSYKNIVNLTGGRNWPPYVKIKNMISFFKKMMDISADKFEEIYLELNLENIGNKRIVDLEDAQWRKICFFLARLEKNRNYIFCNFARGMPLDFDLEFKKNIQQLKEEGCSILYLSDDVFFAPEIGDRIGFLKKGKLLLELKASKMKRMNLTELYFKFLSEK